MRESMTAHLAACPPCRTHADAESSARDTIHAHRADLQGALDSLPDAFRQAVWLRDVEELTYAEMARVLDVPIGTVMSRISRGRRALSEGLHARRAAAVTDAEKMRLARHG